MTADRGWITPYTWEEILEFFPLTYKPAPTPLPVGRIVRSINDKAAQYGDLLKYGDCWVQGYFNFSPITGSSGAVTYAVGTTTGSPTTFTYSGVTTGGGMEWVRRNYNVPAKRGGRIRFHPPGWCALEGTITSATHYLRVRLDNGHKVWLHPTWEVTYL